MRKANLRRRRGRHLAAAAVMLGLLGAAAAQAQVYGVKAQQGAYAHVRDSVLFQVTPTGLPATSATASRIAPVTLGGAATLVDGLAMNSAQSLFAFVNSSTQLDPTSSTAQLVSLNKATGVATVIGATLPNAWIAGAAFDPQDRLWALNRMVVGGASQIQLLQIDPASGAMVGSPITISGLPSTQNYHLDIAFDLDGNAYVTGGVASPASPVVDAVYALDMSSGAASGLQGYPVSMTSTGGGAVFNGMALWRNEEVWFTQSTGVDRVVYAEGTAALAGASNIVMNLTGDTATNNSGAIDLAARPNRVTAADDAASTSVDTPVTIAVLGNDKEFWSPLGENLTVDGSGTQPVSTWPKSTAQGGTVSLNADGTFLYVPPAGFEGTDTFTYRALAADGSWAEATVTVAVARSVPVNHPLTLVLLAVGLAGVAARGRRLGRGFWA